MIATEDQKSSRLYLVSLREKLKAQRVIVIADHNGSAPKNVVETAKLERDKRKKAEEDDEFDEVWVVFDTEGPQNAQRQHEARQAIEQARQLDFHTAISNPSFEYWLLLHYEYFVGPLPDGAAAIRRLKHFIKKYDKNSNVLDETWPNVEEAVKRAERVFLERYVGGSQKPYDCHPCTQMHLLINSLRE